MTPSRLRLILPLTLALLAALVAAPAPSSPKVYHLGHLGSWPLNPDTQPLWNAYLQGLREHGLVEGRNLVIEIRTAEGHLDRYPALAAELVRLRVDLITGSNGAAIRAARDATATIPIVMAGVSDPVGFGLVASLGRPGGNVTGVADFATDLTPKRFQLLKDVVPSATRVAYLAANFTGAPSNPSWMQPETRALGITLRTHQMTKAQDLDDVLAAVARERVDALLGGPNPIVFARRRDIAAFALHHRLPTVFGQREAVLAGGLLSYAVRNTEGFRRAADYVARILLDGAKPGDLPVEQPSRVELVINAKTAKTLGLTIPSSVLARADEVIE